MTLLWVLRTGSSSRDVTSPLTHYSKSHCRQQGPKWQPPIWRLFLLAELFFLLSIWEDDCRGWRDSRESHAFIQNICTPPTPPRTTWAIPMSCYTYCSLSHWPCLPRSPRSFQCISSFKDSCLPQIKAKISNESAWSCVLCPTIPFPHPTCSPSHHKLSPSYTGPFPVPQSNQEYFLLEVTLRGGLSLSQSRDKETKAQRDSFHRPRSRK